MKNKSNKVLEKPSEVQNGKPECSLLKATPEIRNAIENLGDKENFEIFSPIILKYIDELLISSEDLENEDVKYVIRRLVFGLASKRKFYRHGFYATLEMLLHSHPEILPITLTITNKFYSQDQNKTAITDHVIGHILTLGAVIRSGCVMQNSHFATLILEKLHILRGRCSYTDPIVGQFIVHMLKNDGDEGINAIWNVTKSNLLEPIRALSPCLLWIRIVLAREEFMKRLSKKSVSPNFAEDTLSHMSYPIIYALMKKLFLDGVDISQMLNDYLLSLSLYNGEFKGNENLVEFYKRSVLPLLEDKSPNKIGFNFTIVESMVPFLTDSEHIKCVFCPTFVQRLISASTLKGELALSSSRKVVGAILQKIFSHKDLEDDVQITILKQLMAAPGTVRFDSVTGTNLFQHSYEHFKVSTIQDLCTELFIIIENDKYEVTTGLNGLALFSGDFITSAQWISRLVSHPKVVGSVHAKWRATQIASLLKNVFFRKHPPKERQILKESFLRALEHPTKKLEDQIIVVENVVDLTHSYLRKHSKNCAFSAESKECWNEVYKTMKDLQAKDEDLSRRDLTVFRLFYGQMILHLFINPALTQEIIAELNQCYGKAIKCKSRGKKNISEDSGPDWVEVVIDLLLSLLSKGDHYWRKFVVSVLRNICHVMDPASMTLISDVINPNKEATFLSASNEVEETDDEETDEDDDETDEDEDETDEDEDDNETEEDEENDGDEEILSAKEEKELKIMQLREKMQRLVGLPEEDIDMDSVPTDELETLDKNVGAMMKLYLSLRKSNKKKKKTKLAKDETELMHFRTRVCDLLEGIVLEAPSFSHLLNLLHPLLLAMNKASKDSLQQHLYTRLRSIFNELVKVKKFAAKSVTPEDIANEIGPLFDLSHKLSAGMSKEVGLACTFLVRSGLNLVDQDDDQSDKNIIVEAYTNRLKLFFSKKDWDISEVAFSGSLMLDTGLLQPALSLLVEFAFHDSVRFFRKQQALDLLKLSFSNERSLKKIPPKLLRKLQRNLSGQIIKQFDSITDARRIKVLQMVAILDLLKGLKVFHKHNGEFEKSFHWKDVNTTIESFYRRLPIDKMKPLRNAFRALAEVLHIKLERDAMIPTPCEGISKPDTKNQEEEKKEEDVLVPFNGIEDTENKKSEKQIKKQLKKEEKKELKKRKIEEVDKPIIDDEDKKKKMKTKKLNKKLKKIQKLKERQENKLDEPLFENFSISELENL